jgi:hypothetical protein
VTQMVTANCADAGANGSPCVNWPNTINPSGAARVDPDSNLTATEIAASDANNNAETHYRIVNTTQPAYWPFAGYGPFAPPLSNKHIGDWLGLQCGSKPQLPTTCGVSESTPSWKWYSQGWNQAVGGNPDILFQYHHQPFNYFYNLRPSAPGRVAHLADYTDLEADLEQGTLPAVSFVKFQGEYNAHPGYAQIVQGSKAVSSLVSLIQKSSSWGSTVIFITYDEHGGRWDHVAPPQGCSNTPGGPNVLSSPSGGVGARICGRDSNGNPVDPESAFYGGTSFGPGARVPLVIVSPYAKQNHVETTPHESVSILKFIEKRFGVNPNHPNIGSLVNAGQQPLPTRDATTALGDFTEAFVATPNATVPTYDAGALANPSVH